MNQMFYMWSVNIATFQLTQHFFYFSLKFIKYKYFQGYYLKKRFKIFYVRLEIASLFTILKVMNILSMVFLHGNNAKKE